jgi:hypothetical protein
MDELRTVAPNLPPMVESAIDCSVADSTFGG